MSLVALDVTTRAETIIADLGRSYAFNNPVKGLTVLAGSSGIATSVVRPRGDLWMADGIRWRSRLRTLLSPDAGRPVHLDLR